MSLQPLVPFLILVIVASVIGMVSGAADGNGVAVHAAAALCCAIICAAGVRINAPYWGAAAAEAPLLEVVHAARRNTRLAALIYAWGAGALFAVYQLSGLDWYHYYQYGLGAALFALGLLTYVHLMGQPGRQSPPPLALTWAHGAAIAGGLTYLIGTGKAWSTRVDWAANAVFLWGGLAIIVLCIIAAVTQARLKHTAA